MKKIGAGNYRTSHYNCNDPHLLQLAINFCDHKIYFIFPTELATDTIVKATSELFER